MTHIIKTAINLVEIRRILKKIMLITIVTSTLIFGSIYLLKILMLIENSFNEVYLLECLNEKKHILNLVKAEFKDYINGAKNAKYYTEYETICDFFLALGLCAIRYHFITSGGILNLTPPEGIAFCICALISIHTIRIVHSKINADYQEYLLDENRCTLVYCFKSNIKNLQADINNIQINLDNIRDFRSFIIKSDTITFLKFLWNEYLNLISDDTIFFEQLPRNHDTHPKLNYIKFYGI